MLVLHRPKVMSDLDLRDQDTQHTLRAMTQAMFANAGTPPSRMGVAFDAKPQDRAQMEGSLTLPPTFEEMMQAFARPFDETPMGEVFGRDHSLADTMTPEAIAAWGAQADALKAALSGEQSLFGVDDAVVIGAATLAVAVVTLAATVLGVGVAAAGLAYTVYADQRDEAQERAKAEADEAAALAAQQKGDFHIPDLDGDGFPDDPMFPRETWGYQLLGALGATLDGAGLPRGVITAARVSLGETEDGLRLHADLALAGGHATSVAITMR